ncbi:hypothetical protein BH11PLA1_BH11PLA1_17990 [soil metagenome]
MTIVEIAAVVLVIGILSALTLPVLAGVKRGNRDARCMAAIRSAVVRLELYSQDFKDAIPYAGVPVVQRECPGLGPVPVGSHVQFYPGTWALLFPEAWTGPNWNAALQCPKQVELGAATAFQAPAGPQFWAVLPTYWMSPVMSHAPGDFGVSSKGPRTPRCNTLADVRSPSKKVYLYEDSVFCSDDPLNLQRMRMNGYSEPDLVRSIALVDGSVQRLNPLAAFAKVEGQLTKSPKGRWIFVTYNGIAGQDLP